MHEQFPPNLDTDMEEWGAAEPTFRPIAEYQGGDALFRTSDSPPSIFLGRSEGDGYFHYNGEASATWRGGEPVAFCAVPAPLAALARDI